MVHPFRWYVRPNVAEREWFTLCSTSAHHTLPVEAVVEVRELSLRDPEVVPEPSQEILGRCNEHIDGIAHLPNVAHAPTHPIRPVGGVHLVFVFVARESSARNSERRISCRPAHRRLTIRPKGPRRTSE